MLAENKDQSPSSKIFPFIDANEIRKSLIKEVINYGLNECLIEVIEDSFNYDWTYNGANIINDAYYPNLFSWIHDFMWTTGAGGKKSDIIMRYLAENTCCTKTEALLYYRGVRFGWEFPFIGYGAKHRRKGNKRKLTPFELKCYRIAKEFYS